MIRFTIPGPPVPKGRPRVVRGKGEKTKAHAFTPERTRRAERAVALVAKAAGCRVIDGPIVVELTFALPDRRRVDLDNLAKLCTDALTGIAWHDDSQIAELVAHKHVDRECPRTVVEIRPLADPRFSADTASGPVHAAARAVGMVD